MIYSDDIAKIIATHGKPIHTNLCTEGFSSTVRLMPESYDQIYTQYTYEYLNSVYLVRFGYNGEDSVYPKFHQDGITVECDVTYCHFIPVNYQKIL